MHYETGAVAESAGRTAKTRARIDFSGWRLALKVRKDAGPGTIVNESPFLPGGGAGGGLRARALPVSFGPAWKRVHVTS